MGISEDLNNGFASCGDDVASFVVEGDDGTSDVFGEGKKRWGDSSGDGKFTTSNGVDFVFDGFE